MNILKMSENERELYYDRRSQARIGSAHLPWLVRRTLPRTCSEITRYNRMELGRIYHNGFHFLFIDGWTSKSMHVVESKETRWRVNHCDCPLEFRSNKFRFNKDKETKNQIKSDMVHYMINKEHTLRSCFLQTWSTRICMTLLFGGPRGPKSYKQGW